MGERDQALQESGNPIKSNADQEGRNQGADGTMSLSSIPNANPLLLEQALASAAVAKAPLPDASTQLVSATPKDIAPSGIASLLSMPDTALPSELTGEGQVQDFANKEKPKIAVLHQEAHFKPVSSSPALAAPDTRGVVGEAPREAMGIKPSHPLTALQATLTAHAGNDATQDDSLRIMANQTDRDANETATSNAVLQRIAGAVFSEAREASSELRPNDIKTDPTRPVVSRASEGVMRVLNIQLHPVELGIVTVKMRLSGDTLEMELHAQSDETAQLLRKDSEKLSALLRTSGYRPDVVSIHVGTPEASQQDTSFGQRPQSQPQFGGQQQGFAAGSEERPRERAASHERTDKQGKDRNDESISAHRAVGSLYL
ncbi:flagellar hook-length control protein FliK [Microvirga flavescens]|uniref:flagellar hook-length control protein FliK n=1 Tax=Microvirga flavescens TaxID=2249811 RepID=UPI0013001EDB|nr:flagellar hook-length control protein FliK [Microvirga flavescens]